MLMQPAPSSETSRVPSLRFFMGLAPLRSWLAAHAIGATANPAPTKAVLVSSSRRVSAVPSCELDSRGVVLQFIAVFPMRRHQCRSLPLKENPLAAHAL